MASKNPYVIKTSLKPQWADRVRERKDTRAAWVLSACERLPMYDNDTRCKALEVWCNKEQFDRINALAIRQGLSTSEFVRRAIVYELTDGQNYIDAQPASELEARRPSEELAIEKHEKRITGIMRCDVRNRREYLFGGVA